MKDILEECTTETRGTRAEVITLRDEVDSLRSDVEKVGTLIEKKKKLCIVLKKSKARRSRVKGHFQERTT